MKTADPERCAAIVEEIEDYDEIIEIVRLRANNISEKDLAHWLIKYRAKRAARAAARS